MIPGPAQPTLLLRTLSTADGSASYTSPQHSHTTLCGVNYPLEVSYRSKELPEDTYIEVNIRPQNAVAGVKEHHVEQLVTWVLRSVVRGRDTPRTMLQCTLQVTDVEVDESLPGGVKGTGQGESYLELLVGCINAAMLGCLDAGVQMTGIVGAILVAIGKDGKITLWPGLKERKLSSSSHVFGVGQGGELIICESEGNFDIDGWEKASSLARRAVIGRDSYQGEHVAMDHQDPTETSLLDGFRQAVEARVEKDSRWRTN